MRTAAGAPQVPLRSPSPFGNGHETLTVPRCGSGRPEGERDPVHAVPEPGRRWPVVEDVPQVPAAPPAVDLRAHRQEAAVLARAHRVRKRRPEARPPGVTLVLGLRREEREAAAGAEERSLSMLLQERARPRALGAVRA